MCLHAQINAVRWMLGIEPCYERLERTHQCDVLLQICANSATAKHFIGMKDPHTIRIALAHNLEPRIEFPADDDAAHRLAFLLHTEPVTTFNTHIETAD